MSLYNLDWFTPWHSALPEDSRAVTSFTGPTQELTLVHPVTDIDVWCTVTSPEPCMWECSQAIVRHFSTCSVVQRNLLWMETSAGNRTAVKFVFSPPCQLMKPRTQKSSCCKSVQLLASLLWKINSSKSCALSSRQFHLVM